MEIWIVTDAASLDPRLYDAGLALLDPASADRTPAVSPPAPAPPRPRVPDPLPPQAVSSAASSRASSSPPPAPSHPPTSPSPTPPPANPTTQTTPGLDPPLAFNVSHDGAAVAMAFAPDPRPIPADLGARADSDAVRAGLVGVDVMRVAVPHRTTFRELVRGVGDTLTPRERAQLAPPTPERTARRRFFWMWTLKEAFAKARGAGLAFELRRIECDVRAVRSGVPREETGAAVRVTVDGAPPRGWAFVLFEFDAPHAGAGAGADAGADVDVGAGGDADADAGQARYQGVAARFVGGDAPPTFVVRRVGGSRLDARADGADGAGAEVVYRDEADALVERAVRVLGGGGGGGDGGGDGGAGAAPP
ncbi:hypothetical protein HETIRDRAFT_458147 [Heterobasidion irregulare TC 32-1]|uniref:holo-[acyl-carrier-protein] synthase n=1 Tax=Heterobasidion irregulare (strain TC 32-1) TaxID=747525 RepID=W4KGC3_HETIT|nr:uncharacterized protein HETIRDRAFT_458147 [Heterobasidion irregulare TC 32-1]ETW84345.1 hypothetical protein HETIRDRAFT_458147 [Heterobasidion irregulare TC 32-1]